MRNSAGNNSSNRCPHSIARAEMSGGDISRLPNIAPEDARTLILLELAKSATLESVAIMPAVRRHTLPTGKVPVSVSGEKSLHPWLTRITWQTEATFVCSDERPAVSALIASQP